MGTRDDDTDLRSLVEELIQRVDEQQRVIVKQQRRIEELEVRLKRDSRTSSRPPSSDAPWSKRRQGRKPKSPRSQGGQPGHDGQGRDLFDVSVVDEIHALTPRACGSCGHGELEMDVRKAHRHQVTVLPRRLARIVEYQLRKGRWAPTTRIRSAAASCAGRIWRGTFERSPKGPAEDDDWAVVDSPSPKRSCAATASSSSTAIAGGCGAKRRTCARSSSV